MGDGPLPLHSALFIGDSREGKVLSPATKILLRKMLSCVTSKAATQARRLSSVIVLSRRKMEVWGLKCYTTMLALCKGSILKNLFTAASSR